MHEDFDVDSLAVYLHLTPPQVAKLADRGKLPARKVAGQWRFSPAEIHQWLENRIGLSDEEELVAMENVLQQSAPIEERADISIGELLPVETIAVPLPARTRDSVIRSMVELAARSGFIWDPEKMAEAVRSREEMHPTAMEGGVALLHPRRPMAGNLDQPFLALGITSSGIPFGAGMPLTDVFFLICSVEDRGHLRVLARLSRLLTLPGFLDSLRTVPDAATARQLICEAEKSL
jgi:PTS system nitrogen regulatory IIA component